LKRDFAYAGIESVVNDEHPKKQESGLDFTDVGIVSVVNDEYPEKQ
jgi:hypothetical protein